MKKKCLLLSSAILLATIVSAAQSSSSIRLGRATVVGDMNNFSAGLPFTQWRSGHLIAWSKSEEVVGKIGIYGSNLQLEKFVSFAIDGAESVSIVSVDMTRMGEFVASGVATQHGAKARFLALISSNGAVNRVVRTEPYLPQYVCADDDGFVWTVGEEWLGPGKVKQSGYDVLRQYSFEKGLIRGVAGREKFRGTGVSFGGPVHSVIIQCDGDTVRLYSDVTHQLFYFDTKTGVLTETDVEPLPGTTATATGMAMTASGRALASVRSLDPGEKARLFELGGYTDGGMRHWIPVPGTECVQGGPCILEILGTAHKDLILEEGFEGTPKIYRAEVLDE